MVSILQKKLSWFGFLLLVWFLVGTSWALATPISEQLLNQNKKTKGLCLVISDDSSLILDMSENSDFRIFAIIDDDTVKASVKNATDNQVTVYNDDGAIPFADNYVDVIITESITTGIDEDEVLRALCPKGNAYVVTNSTLALSVNKPRRAGEGDWRHWYNEPDNRLVSDDTLVKAPFLPQWFKTPFFMACPSTSVAAGGRLFTAVEEGATHDEASTRNTLFVRNGYNGTVLWTRDLPLNYRVFRSVYVATEELLYLAVEHEVLCLDAETGVELHRISPANVTGDVKWISMIGDQLIILSGEEDSDIQIPPHHIFDGIKSYWAEVRLNETIDFGFCDTITAYNTVSSNVVWQNQEIDKKIDTRATASKGGSLYYFIRGESLKSIDLATGATNWTSTHTNATTTITDSTETYGYMHRFRSVAGMICTSNQVYIQTADGIFGFSSETGALLSQDPGESGWKRRIYEIDGVVSPQTPDGPCIRFSIVGGVPLKRNEVGLRFFRPGCNEGMIPANGMLYGVANSHCRCLHIQVNGSVAFSPTNGTDYNLVVSDETHLTQTGVPSGETVTTSADWPCYRGNIQRSSSSSSEVSVEAMELFRMNKTNQLVSSAPVVVGDNLYLGGGDGIVKCVNMKTQTEVWRFFSGAAVKYPPTIYNGKALFGSEDGFVYALNADSGALIWKFQAAPAQRIIDIYGSMSSTWPVNSGVLVENGVAYFTAGLLNTFRTHVYAVNADTGSMIWHNESSGGEGGVTAQGGLTIAGENLYLSGGTIHCPATYNLQTGEFTSIKKRNYASRNGYEIGVLPSGALLFGGDILHTYNKRMLARKNNKYANFGILPLDFGANDPEEIQLFNALSIMPVWDDNVFVSATYSYGGLSLWSQANLNNLLQEIESGNEPNYSGSPLWFQGYHNVVFMPTNAAWGPADVDVLALALSANLILAVCEKPSTPDTMPATEWELVARDREDGEIIWQYDLPSEPQKNAIAISREGVVITIMKDGTILGYGTAETKAQLRLSEQTLNIPEGSNDTFSVRLTLQPASSPISVTIVRAAESDESLSISTGATLTFTTNNWLTNQTVTITASQDADFANGTATFICSSEGMNDKSVIVSEIDDETNLAYSLPWEEPFDARTNGAVAGQYGWTGTGTVQTATTQSGAKALSLAESAVAHTFVDHPTNVWITLWAQPVPGDAPETIAEGASAVFYVSTNNLLVAYSNETPVEIEDAIVSDGWNKFVLSCDYSSKVWSLELNDVSRVGNFAFHGAPASFQGLEISESTTNVLFVDSINITDSAGEPDPDDEDGDGLPDSWEITHYGSTNVNPNATASNGVNTVRQAYIAGLDPTSLTNRFLVSVLSSPFSVLSWNAASGRVYTIYWSSNLLSGFQPLESNITAGAFTDTLHVADAEGFYKIDVRAE